MRHLPFLLLFLFSASAGVAKDPFRLPDSERVQLETTAEAVRVAIIHEDTNEIASIVSKSGLMCTDTNYSHAQVANFLKNKKSHLWLSLFDSARFSRLCGDGYPSEFPAISEKEFFIKSTNLVITIIATDKRNATVTYQSSTKGHYKRDWYFRKEGSHWKLVDAFIVGGCFCG
jgi:hypothetical protein